MIARPIFSADISKPLLTQRQRLTKFTERRHFLQAFGSLQADQYFTSDTAFAYSEMSDQQYNYERAIATVVVGLQRQGDVYLRKVYTPVDLIGEVGGLSVGLYLLMHFSMLVYTSRWFKLELIES